MSELGDLVAGTLGEIDDVSERSRGELREWARGRQVFAALARDAVELRLDPAIAAAAMRTPDTEASARGREWVRFSPLLLDGHAIDRLEAWLDLAYRRAADRARA